MFLKPFLNNSENNLLLLVHFWSSHDHYRSFQWWTGDGMVTLTGLQLHTQAEMPCVNWYLSLRASIDFFSTFFLCCGIGLEGIAFGCWRLSRLFFLDPLLVRTNHCILGTPHKTWFGNGLTQSLALKAFKVFKILMLFYCSCFQHIFKNIPHPFTVTRYSIYINVI